jgi:signal transduction histidine kinase
MLKVKIVHKGLILVAVPLVFGTAFISLLFLGLSESSRLVERELKLKDAMISHIVASRCTVSARKSAACFDITHDQSFMDKYRSNSEKALASDEHLRKLLSNENSLLLPPKESPSQKLFFGGPPNLTSTSFLQELQRLSDRQTKAALNAMNSLQITLWGGMLASAFITILLAIFFCLNITNRLLIILHNTASLSRGTSLSPPLRGDDEIAQLDQFLYQSATEIRELERFKKEMIGVVSHELKSPLSSVGGFLESLGAGVFGELNPKAQNMVARAHQSVRRLMGLVKELLDLDRLELEMSPEEIAVDGIITSSVDTVKELSEQSGIEIIVRNVGGKVFADRDRLVQVIVNLLSNAMKFSPPKGKVTIETSRSDGWFECRVSDQGRGIPEDFRKQVFEPFKQIDTKDKTTKKGTGLGLTISRSIVEQHGGMIGVDSVEGKGSTFWFKIPASAPTNQKSTQDRTKRSSSPSPLQSESVKVDKSNAGRMRKFSVLQQGLVIIAVPLIFQFAFVSVIGCLLCQVREQIQREENSREMLNTLNLMAEKATSSAYYLIMYLATENPDFKKSWEDGKNIARHMLDPVSKLSTTSEDIEDIKETRDALEKASAILDGWASKNQKTIGSLLRNPSFVKEAQKIIEMSGMGRDIATIGGASSLREMVDSLSPKHGLSGPSGPGGLKVAGRSSDSGDSKMYTQQLQYYFKETANVMKPWLEGQKAQERLMARETARGQKLSAERSQTLRTLEQTFFAGIILNIALSILLAVTLMRSLTSRLQHVMENTARLVSRNALDLPKGGSDEIAYLDRMLFETGNHLLELETFKRQLISIVSHELRTPLLSVSSALELFGEGVFGDLPEKAKIRLKFAQEEADRLIRLINDLLDIEKMEAGKFVLDKSEIKVAELIETSTTSVVQLAEAKQIKLEPSVVDATLCADRDRLCQVLINLLSNAIKFSPEAGVISVKVETGESYMEFRVSDQGRGIPEELRAKIFDRFVQVEKTDASVRGGSGLGLAIAKAIVEQHGGTIGVESELGHGSTFWFKVPLHETESNTLSA